MDNTYLILPTSWKPNRNAFLAKLKIGPIGLGAQFFNKVYDSIFIDSTELVEEYTKYYSVEYSSLSDYIVNMYDTELPEDDLEADFLFLVTWLPSIADSNYEDNVLKDILSSISTLEREQNENQT